VIQDKSMIEKVDRWIGDAILEGQDVALIGMKKMVEGRFFGNSLTLIIVSSKTGDLYGGSSAGTEACRGDLHPWRVQVTRSAGCLTFLTPKRVVESLIIGHISTRREWIRSSCPAKAICWVVTCSTVSRTGGMSSLRFEGKCRAFKPGEARSSQDVNRPGEKDKAVEIDEKSPPPVRRKYS